MFFWVFFFKKLDDFWFHGRNQLRFLLACKAVRPSCVWRGKLFQTVTALPSYIQLNHKTIRIHFHVMGPSRRIKIHVIDQFVPDLLALLKCFQVKRIALKSPKVPSTICTPKFQIPSMNFKMSSHKVIWGILALFYMNRISLCEATCLTLGGGTDFVFQISAGPSFTGCSRQRFTAPWIETQLEPYY